MLFKCGIFVAITWLATPRMTNRKLFTDKKLPANQKTQLMKIIKLLFLLIALFEMDTVIAQTKEAKSIDSLMNLFIKNDCFNGDMLIAADNKPIYERAVGYRDNQTKEKLLHNSIFNIGSISKPFTSVAIL